MTTTQKEKIAMLRNKGKSYTTVAAELGLSENTIKSYCRRNNLGESYINKKKQTADTCGNCGNLLNHTSGAKKKRFCSDRCRMVWWNSHPEAVNRKAVYHFTCPVCNTDFESYGNSRRKYCSGACFGLARRSAHE